MIKIIRNTTPFIILGYCLVFTLLSHYKVYLSFYPYLGDLLGFSLLTDFFMLSVFMNRKYCTATKIAVLTLMVLNILNIIYVYFDTNGELYDMCLIALSLLIIVFYKIE